MSYCCLMRVLVVEDDPQLGPMLARGLRERAYAVDLVADGVAAVQHAALQNRGGRLAAPFRELNSSTSARKSRSRRRQASHGRRRSTRRATAQRPGTVGLPAAPTEWPERSVDDIGARRLSPFSFRTLRRLSYMPRETRLAEAKRLSHLLDQAGRAKYARYRAAIAS